MAKSSRLLTLTVSFLLLALTVGTTAANAATAYQNGVISAAMAHMPGGTRVSASKVVWGGGRVVLAVPASINSAGSPDSIGACDFGSFCAWSEPNFNGCFQEIPTGDSPNLWFNWALFSGLDCSSAGTWSLYNNSDFRGWKEQFHSGGTQLSQFRWEGGTDSGDNFCVSPGQQISSESNSQHRIDGWMQGTTNPAAC